MERPVRVGVVGLGGMGVNHAGNARDLGHEIVAGADVVPEARNAFAEEFGAVTFESHDEMYEEADLDCVFIATPNMLHAPAAIGALERGINVLCEKPLADTLEAAERIATAADESDAFCMVGFHNRFSTGAKVLSSYREEGRFGDLTHVDANFLRRRGIPGQGSWFTNKELSGGGALIDIGVHAVDFGMYLAGFPDVREVSAVTRTAFGSRPDYTDPDRWSDRWRKDENAFDVDDSASAFLRCESGLSISLDVSWAANLEPSREFVIRGTEAGARLDLGGESLSLYGTDQSGVDHYTNTEVQGTLEPSGYEAEAEYFLNAVETGEQPEMNTVQEGLAVQRVIDAIYRSSEQNRAVEL